MIQLTESAIHYFNRLVEQEKAQFIRISTVNKGCSGLSYQLDLVDEAEPKDNHYEYPGFSVVIDHQSLDYLKNMVIDCVKSGLQEILEFRNPNAIGACGCGESFAVSDEKRS